VPADLITNPQENISRMLRDRIAAGDFPAAVYVVAENGEAVFSDGLGNAVVIPETYSATMATIFDLASLTKPFVTGLICARLVQLGELTLDSSIANYLLEFDRPDKSRITVRELLTHSAGLKAWLPLYLVTDGNRDGVMSAIANEPLKHPPGERVIYSDLGFITLGVMLERLTGLRLSQLAQREIFDPLTLQKTFFNPKQAARTGVAACETGNVYERDMCETDFPTRQYSGWRKEVVWGEVHDGNAFFLGGAAGHAGLFSDAEETLRLAKQFLGPESRLLSRETCKLFRQNMTPGLNEARSFAWQLAATKDSSAGSSLPPEAFGHNGFTGTSCWIDPINERVFLLLTNRTHNRSLPFANINQVRRDFHTLATEALDARRVKPS
jgi:serine-type D-Ala-D-Ala carboxypeptidase